MIIKCYNNLSPENKINKNLTLVKEISGDFNGEILNSSPKIVINQNTLDFDYIQVNDNFYFINDYNIYRNGLIILECEKDVLMSNKDFILNQSGILDKSEFKYNSYLIDNTITLNKKQIITKRFNFDFSDTNNFILITAG